MFPASCTHHWSITWMPILLKVELLRPPLCHSLHLCGSSVDHFSIPPPPPPPCLCIRISTVLASSGTWLMGKLVLAEDVEDNAQVFDLNKHTLQFILLDFVLWMRTPAVILLQSRICWLAPDHRLCCAAMPLKACKSLINEAISRFINN